MSEVQKNAHAGFLHHVEIYVSDLPKTTAFWSWFLGELGYAKFQEWKQGVSWKLGPTYLVFVQTRPEHLDREYHRCKVGLNHLAFHGRSKEHVDALARQLRARGASILYEDRHPRAAGNHAVFFEDPDRIKVELVAPEP